MDDGAAPSTAACADACVQLGIPPRLGPEGLRPVEAGWRVFGPARGVVHLGSVDVFLEACEELEPGDVLIADDGGRTDRACVGDLTALEVRAAGGAGLVVNGCHRDTSELRSVGLPVFSLGARPNGPIGVEPRPGGVPRFGEHAITTGDLIVCDEDGGILLDGDRAEEIVAAAREIARTETSQADGVRAGRSLREQLGFAEYLEHRRTDPSYTLREHLRRRGGAIER